MSWRLVLRRRAVREATHAHDWYEAQREGLGETFLIELERVLGVLQEHPHRFPPAWRLEAKMTKRPGGRFHRVS